MILAGSLTSDTSSESRLRPEELFFTSSGRIGVIIDADTELSLHLTELQRNIAAVLPTVGGCSHARFVFSLLLVLVHKYRRCLTGSGHPRAQEVAVMQIIRHSASSMVTSLSSYLPSWTLKIQSRRSGTVRMNQRNFQSRRTRCDRYWRSCRVIIEGEISLQRGYNIRRNKQPRWTRRISVNGIWCNITVQGCFLYSGMREQGKQARESIVRKRWANATEAGLQRDWQYSSWVWYQTQIRERKERKQDDKKTEWEAHAE